MTEGGDSVFLTIMPEINIGKLCFIMVPGYEHSDYRIHFTSSRLE